MPKFYDSYKKQLLFIITLFPLFLIQPLLAQGTGSIRGKVFDKSTKDVLFGANVILKGTSLGSASDLNGNYKIINVPAGKYSVVISYIGYNSTTEEVTITANKELVQNFYLEPRALEGKTVVVTAQAEGQLSAINQQLNSNTIENVVSKARIKELPDVNAAESIGRLPGVSIERSGGEATKVEIRGLDPKYSLISVNGVLLPATGSSDRSVDLSLISSNMLDGISLKKVTTPDMDADVLGGTVDLRLKEAPDSLVLNGSAQGGYNELQKYYGDYNFNVGGSNRFFDGKLGIIANLNTDNYDRSSDKLQAGYTGVGSSSGVSALVDQELNLREQKVNRKRTGASILADYIIPNGKVTANGFFNQLKWTGLYHVNDMWTPNAGYNTNRHYYQLEQTGGTTNVFTSALQVHQDFGWIKYDASVAKTGSFNNTPDDRFWQFEQDNGSFPTTAITPTTPLQEIPRLAVIDTNRTWLAQIISNSYRVMENTSSAQFNVQVPLNFSDQITGFFKAGGKFRWVFRSNNQNQNAAENLQYGNNPNPNGAISALGAFFPQWSIDSLTKKYGGLPITPFLTNYTRSNFLDGNYPLGFVLNQNMMNLLTDSIKTNPSYWLNYSIPSLGYDYSGYENYQAGYIMAQYDITKYVTVIPGVRWEGEHTVYHGQSFRQINLNGSQEGPPADYTLIETTRNHNYWLPMVNVIARPTDWLQVKLARTENLTYPDYIQYAPITYISSDQSTINAANSQLKTSHAVSYDVEVSVYQNYVGYFSADAFTKKINDLIFSTAYKLQPGLTPPAGLNIPATWLKGSAPTVYTYMNNPNPSNYYGIELDWQTHFWYLPSFLQGLILDVNYTHIYSEMYLNYDSTYVVSRIGTPPRQTIVYGFAQRQVKTRMPNQPANIVNVTLGYDIAGFSARLSYLYQADKLAGIGYSGIYPSTVLSTYTGSYNRLDLSLQQKIGANLQVFVNLNNLNAEPDKTYTGQGMVNPQYFEYYGFTMDLGIRYNL
jgi:TonB-dependent receptor